MIRSTCSRQNRFNLASQRGMGATVVLFTIALIVLVGAALAYASRDNPTAITTQSAKLQAALLLKQSADYRDAYSRFIFDGKDAATMTFNAPVAPNEARDLLFPASQYGSYQSPPAAAMASGTGGSWAYNQAVDVTGVGTSGANTDSVVYVDNVAITVCEQVNAQLYGVAAVDPASITLSDLSAPAAWGVTSGRSVGCFKNLSGTPHYVFYATLAEN